MSASSPPGPEPNFALQQAAAGAIIAAAGERGRTVLIQAHRTLGPNEEPSTVSTNADRARRWYKEVWVPGGEATVYELMAEDIIGYMEGADIRSRDEFLTERRRLLEAFPDLAIVADDVIAEGTKVAVRWHVDATHTGDGLGSSPSNRRVSFRGMTWLEFKDGRIVLGWDNWNLGGLLQSLSSPS